MPWQSQSLHRTNHKQIESVESHLFHYLVFYSEYYSFKNIVLTRVYLLDNNSTIDVTFQKITFFLFVYRSFYNLETMNTIPEHHNIDTSVWIAACNPLGLE